MAFGIINSWGIRFGKYLLKAEDPSIATNDKTYNRMI